MTLLELLVARNLTSALIVDDAYDTTPKAEDLAADGDAWSNFIADVGEDLPHIVEAFPAYEAMEVDELQRSDAFVAAIWDLKDKLRPELWNALFEGYEQATRSDRAFLKRLEAALVALGVTPVPSGRTLPAGARDARLIFADLFLGATQEPADMARSLDRVRALVAGREASPPPVILMSRSGLLTDKKTEFRDDAGLHSAIFRVSTKQELLENGTLERILERLALHYPDAQRVATFVQQWKEGLEGAADRFLLGIRRLDLSDYGQIREMLLNFEGQPLGSYLLDVFDRVLEHEIEGHVGTIAAAEALNEIDPETYPAPHIAGSPDLQDLVARSIWQHPRRLTVKTTVADLPVGFGDVLVAKSVLAGAAPGAGGADLADTFVVLSPACDLVREGGVKRILLMRGGLAELNSRTWAFDDKLKTPIIILPGNRRMWIRWDTSDLSMLTPNEVRALLGEEGSHSIQQRLRESNALELQQRLLATMGRIGLVAQMPGTFPVALRAYTSGPDGLRALALPAAERDGGVCYGGRDPSGDDTARLVLTEAVIDELLTVIGKLTDTDVHNKARATLGRLKAATSLASDFQKGLRAPLPNQIHSPIKATGPDGEGAQTDSTVGLIFRNPPNLDVTQDMRKLGAVILVLTDLSAS